MIGNKLLIITSAYFNLPDSFDGTLGEALKMLAEYRLECETRGEVFVHNDEHEAYRDLVDNENIQASLVCSVLELRDGEWKDANHCLRVGQIERKEV